jgi:probable HAF family extracellular repeat protein
VILLQTFVTLVFAQPSSGFKFTSFDIPTRNGQQGVANDVSTNGRIVGFWPVEGVGFLLNRKFEVKEEIECPNASDTTPTSINKRGEIAGNCFTDRIRGFVRGKNGEYTFLDFPGATLTEASGINDNGQVVGDYRDVNGVFHGFFWDAGQYLTIDVPFPGVTQTAASAINGIGQIVGVYDDNIGTGRHGFLYDNGVFTSFDFPDATRSTSLRDINDRGQIVGVGISVDGDVIVQGFLLQDDSFSSIEVPLSNGLINDARGINSRGQVVGEYEDTGLQRHGFIATPVKVKH